MRHVAGALTILRSMWEGAIGFKIREHHLCHYSRPAAISISAHRRLLRPNTPCHNRYRHMIVAETNQHGSKLTSIGDPPCPDLTLPCMSFAVIAHFLYGLPETILRRGAGRGVRPNIEVNFDPCGWQIAHKSPRPHV